MAVDDMDRPVLMNPDCWAGKHQACAGDAWDDSRDEPASCECTCHRTTDVPVSEAFL